ncbi:phasin family protein [Niallia sp. 03133]|uniref:phasin family protein n=1 Tax=Niallia sp. 03133 TaxID=3458060 RepID=UPI00404401D6
MKNTINQFISLGLGLAAASKEQVEKMVNDLVARGEVSKNDSKDMVNQLLEKGYQAKKEMDGVVKTKVQQALKELDVVTMEEYRELERRIAVLEQKSE